MEAGPKWRRKMMVELQKLEEHQGVINIISSPYQICEEEIAEIVANNQLCFNPDADFPRFGVVPSTGSAGWVEVWTRVMKICAKKGGTAFFMWCAGPERVGLIGSQQTGEREACRDLSGKDILKIKMISYTLTQDKLQKLRISESTRRLGSEWVFKKDSVVLQEALGEGTYSTVYLGDLSCGPHGEGKMAVAVKQLKIRIRSNYDEVMKSLKHEFDLLRRCEHPNIIQLYGVVIEEPMCLLLEYASRGNLRDVLDDDSQALKSMGTTQVVDCTHAQNQLLAGTAAGMSYLHGLNPCILHQDLKTSNILVFLEGRSGTPDVVPKLSDFGLSAGPCVKLVEALSSTRSMTGICQGAGTFAYQAPELFDAEPHFGNQEDKLTYYMRSEVYAYGIVCWEVLTGDRPWLGKTLTQILSAVTLKGERPNFNRDSLNGMFVQIMERSWAQDPGSRPSFKDLLVDLEASTKTRRAVSLAAPTSQVSRPADQGKRIFPAEGYPSHPEADHSGAQPAPTAPVVTDFGSAAQAPAQAFNISSRGPTPITTAPPARRARSAESAPACGVPDEAPARAADAVSARAATKAARLYAARNFEFRRCLDEITADLQRACVISSPTSPVKAPAQGSSSSSTGVSANARSPGAPLSNSHPDAIRGVRDDQIGGRVSSSSSIQDGSKRHQITNILSDLDKLAGDLQSVFTTKKSGSPPRASSLETGPNGVRSPRSRASSHSPTRKEGYSPE